MNKYDFLSRLRTALSPLPQEERDAAMSYYEEFFSEAGEDNEQSVIASLGAPEELAKSIIDENNLENPANKGGFAADEQTASGFEGSIGFTPPPAPAPAPAEAGKWSSGQIALFVVLAVLSSPIWLGLLCAVFGVIVGIFGVIVGVVAALGACAVAFLAGGFIALFEEPPLGIMMIGLSFICAGLFPLVIYPLSKLAVKGTKACVKQIGSLINKITGRKEKVQ
ncbi:MAG: DUF1700 domain-containing protein [Firmicutes bacterium]|nr:DUF1700 domain-containing protein [[Eubacterium] siraeum]MCM1488415.1 DUF1700 domain-containing protein [Bacillota bacterium]